MRLLPLLVALWSAPAWSESRQLRFAIVVGANLGEPDEAPLQFAESDATQFADTLTRFGGVREENLILLRGRDKARVDQALAELTERVRAANATGAEVLLFVYYSGHADARALHLRGERLLFKRLEQQVKAAGADLVVMVVDACHSGSLTRVKGGAPAAPFAITADDRLDTEGMAIITSAAAGEDAQESDRLAGGVFTHHFVVGLRGAADASKDQSVTLSEAYRYAYDETRRTTSRAPVLQHPTYSFQIRGKSDIVVTRLRESAGMGQVHLLDAGEWMLLPQAQGELIELSAESDVQVRVPPGRYIVRHRRESTVAEGIVRVAEGAPRRVAAADLAVMAYGQSLRRGLSGRSRSVWGIGTTAEVQSTRDGIGPTLQFGLAGRVDLRPVTLVLEGTYAEAREENESLQLQQRTFGLTLGARKMFDIGPLALGAGVRVGGGYTRQLFETQGTAPDRAAFVGRAGPTAHVEFVPTHWLTLGLRGGLDALIEPESLAAAGLVGLEVVFHVGP